MVIPWPMAYRQCCRLRCVHRSKISKKPTTRNLVKFRTHRMAYDRSLNDDNYHLFFRGKKSFIIQHIHTKAITNHRWRIAKKNVHTKKSGAIDHKTNARSNILSDNEMKFSVETNVLHNLLSNFEWQESASVGSATNANVTFIWNLENCWFKKKATKKTKETKNFYQIYSQPKWNGELISPWPVIEHHDRFNVFAEKFN